MLLVKKLLPTAKLPTKAHDSDLGYDLYIHDGITLSANEFGAKLYTRIAIKLPEKFGAIIRDRSSLAKQGLFTSGGVIDNGYTGEIIVIINNTNDEKVYLEAGSKIAQMILIPFYQFEIIETTGELPATPRGDKGFGSSGK